MCSEALWGLFAAIDLAGGCSSGAAVQQCTGGSSAAVQQCSSALGAAVQHCSSALGAAMQQGSGAAVLYQSYSKFYCWTASQFLRV